MDEHGWVYDDEYSSFLNYVLYSVLLIFFFFSFGTGFGFGILHFASFFLLHSHRICVYIFVLFFPPPYISHFHFSYVSFFTNSFLCFISSCLFCFLNTPFCFLFFVFHLLSFVLFLEARKKMVDCI
ncbi:hypothetical protein BZA77DRAFT_305573 [Pyronema omphalodes]|nr:hypothetical protein BZA77DRAFT_305573 [Pyronema omphalodes]